MPSKKKIYPWIGARNLLIPTYSSIARFGCDGKEHPKFDYRPYRRGFNRCITCGGTLSFMARMMNTVYQENPLFNLLSKKDKSNAQ